MSVFKKNMTEDIVGALGFLPVMFYNEPWQIKHDRHHTLLGIIQESYKPSNIQYEFT